MVIANKQLILAQIGAIEQNLQLAKLSVHNMYRALEAENAANYLGAKAGFRVQCQKIELSLNQINDSELIEAARTK